MRPWGTWAVLDQGRGYKVKQLSVRPHARLSLQRHEHRSESWVVVAGTATCTVGRSRLVLGPGEMVTVPRGFIHRLANEHGRDLLVVEVQLGPYTGEDDIVRLADDYGRTG